MYVWTSMVNIEVFFRGVENSYIVSKLVSLEKKKG